MSIRFDSDQSARSFIERPITIYEKQSPLLSEIKAAGNIEYNVKGNGFEYQVQTGVGSNVVTLGLGHSYSDKRTARDGYRIAATMDYSGYTMSDAFDGVELERIGGPWAKRDMFKQAAEKFDRDLGYVMEEEMWLGNGAPSGNSIQVGGSGTRITGITTAVLATGTYMGVDRASYTGWASYTLAGTAGPTGTFANDVAWLIDRMCNQTTYKGFKKQSVDLLFFTKANFTVYQARIFNQNTNVPAGDPYQTGMVYNGRKLKIDDNCPTSTIYGLNSSTWEIKSPSSKLYKMRTIPDHPGHAIGTVVKDVEMQFALACKSPRHNWYMTSAAATV